MLQKKLTDSKRLNREEVITLIKSDPEYSELREAARRLYLKANPVQRENLIDKTDNKPDIEKECREFRKLFVGINYELPTSDRLMYSEIILPIFLPKVVED
jgi:hypothetical protein